MVDPYMVDESKPHEPHPVCEMFPEYEDGVEGIAYTIDGVADDFYDDVDFAATTVYFSDVTMEAEGGLHGGGKLTPNAGSTVTKDSSQGGVRGRRSNRRRLAPTTGTSSLLIVYSKPPDASNSKTPAEMADELFGTYVGGSDPVNARSQVLACSRNKLEYIPACDDTSAAGCAAAVADSTIVNGVIEVDITSNVSGVASGTVVNWATTAANALLGTHGLSTSSFTQVMHVIPDAASWGGAAAWAYLPGSVSAFRSTYSYRMGVQVHEFGHNIGLHHSGFGTASYADHSCLMGNPSYGDDGPQICWNGAKSWESDWYEEDNITVDAKNGDTFDGLLVGVADWSSQVYIPGEHKVVVEVPNSSGQNLYLMYNRKKGPNVGVTFAADEVTLTYGSAMAISWHEAALNENESHTIANFDGGSNALVVTVCEKSTTTAGADTVRVLIYADDANPLSCATTDPPTTSAPTDEPTNVPSLAPSVGPPATDAPTTDAPTTDAPTSTPSFAPTRAPSGSPTYIPTLSPDASPTSLPTPAPSLAPSTNPDPSCGNDVCEASIGETCGTCWEDCCPNVGATIETWTGIPGTTLSAIDWATDPDEYSEIRGDGQGLLEGPTNARENYGERIRTYLIPPVTGSYTFWIASDDQGSLLLSSDASQDNAVEIARVPTWTNSREFGKFAEQRSDPITLVAGTPYFLEAKMKEGGQGDNLAIAWAYPGQTQEVIPASYGRIKPPDTASPTASPTITPSPTSSCGNDVCEASIGETCGTCWEDCCPNVGATIETWTGIPGTTLSAIDWATDPDEYSEIRGDGQGLLEGPTNARENYGERIRTYLIPPVTGSYTFWIASDDQGSLLLSSDASQDNAVEIARVPTWTNSREFGKFAEQRSDPITLVAGTPYFLEAKMKEGEQGDNLAIAWEYPGQTQEVIPASYGRIKPPDTTASPTASPTASGSSSPTASPTAPPTQSCQDDPTWSFALDCSWVAESPSERCDMMGTDGRMAREACLGACDQPCVPELRGAPETSGGTCLGFGAECRGPEECCSGSCNGDGRCGE